MSVGLSNILDTVDGKPLFRGKPVQLPPYASPCLAFSQPDARVFLCPICEVKPTNFEEGA